MKEGIENKMANIMLLYKLMVKPYLEHCILMQSPHLKKEMVEKDKGAKSDQND